MSRPKAASCTIVIKLGTSSIVHEQTHQPLLGTLSSVVETVVYLRRTLGHKVILVSSGAIGVGLKRMDMDNKPKSLSGKQVRESSLLCRMRGFGLLTTFGFRRWRRSDRDG